jgi:hypothetical protein
LPSLQTVHPRRALHLLRRRVALVPRPAPPRRAHPRGAELPDTARCRVARAWGAEGSRRALCRTCQFQTSGLAVGPPGTLYLRPGASRAEEAIATVERVRREHRTVEPRRALRLVRRPRRAVPPSRTCEFVVRLGTVPPRRTRHLARGPRRAIAPRRALSPHR